MKLLKPIIVLIVTIAILAWALPNVGYSDYLTLILAGVVMTLLEKTIKPILKFLFLPINIVTLGFFSIIINVFILWLVTYFVPGFNIEPMIIFGLPLNQFFTLLFVSALIGFCQRIINFIL
ncbi:phage holin family protein [Candidatus Woesebacteria bacterium]|jgi:putative membrane protein|nr:phage holin family protein [Candidatus Woesebacteria bacterium]HNV44923.1 phage holin family protein [Candidatus Woesebacteria bacterium]HOA12052.1 phage holin family protein [Candidatus Woesebacteria bacterium]HOC07757.1 phage holin family protein [Candidatus Woesebacteria bacterium]HOI04916.1 phage holin family protein [Candidatus Woesebacteria bacterium]